jgi:hypothetical protein
MSEIFGGVVHDGDAELYLETPLASGSGTIAPAADGA